VAEKLHSTVLPDSHGSIPVGTAVFWVHSARGWLDNEATQSLPVHPTQLYFAAVWVAAALAALAWKRRQVRDGEACLVGLVVWGLGQVIVEALRDPDYLRGTPYLGESGLAPILVGVVTFLALRTASGRAPKPGARASLAAR
jgi:phosphatidylglycerol---prolipoprotein diacylglyceryl transferase